MDFSLSVVIPNFNNEVYIEMCIRSVMSQTYKGLKEIIVVDDASTDCSREIILKMKNMDQRVIPIFLKKNSKVSCARNCGLDKATSKYVTFLDGDDYYFNPDKLKNEMELVKRYVDKGVDIIAYSTIVRVSSDGKRIKKPKVNSKKVLNGKIYGRLLIGLGMEKIMRDYCVKTDLIRTVGGYNEHSCFFEDYELILKLARNTPFYSTLNYGTAYRESINGLSKRSYQDQVKTIDDISMREIDKLSFLNRILYKTGRVGLSEMKYFIKSILRFLGH